MSYNFRIGIVGWSTGENSFGATKPYLDLISRFGTPIILCPDFDTDLSLDMVFLPGGADTAAWYNNKRPSFWNSPSDQFKEFFMHKNLANYIQAGIPIWGTCLGMQMLCTYFGADLTQNLPFHPTTPSDDRAQQVHPLIFTEEYSELEQDALNLVNKGLATGSKKRTKFFEVNSLHHQGIYADEGMSEVADINVVATSHDDIVEIFEHKELPIAGAQGHFEEDQSVPVTMLFIKTLNRSPKYLKYKETVNEEAVVEG